MRPAWPAAYTEGRVGVRPLRRRDASTWSGVRIRDRAWLEPWEGAPEAQGDVPWEDRHTTGVYRALWRLLRVEARAGRAYPFAVTYDDRLVGQVTAGGVVRGAFDSATLGYWVAADVAGRGVVPTAVALVVDHLFGVVGLHRVEANIRPENRPSLRVVEKLGFAPEGRHRRYLFIDGAWRDHVTYALLREEVPGGLLRRLHQER